MSYPLNPAAKFMDCDSVRIKVVYSIIGGVAVLTGLLNIFIGGARVLTKVVHIFIDGAIVDCFCWRIIAIITVYSISNINNVDNISVLLRFYVESDISRWFYRSHSWQLSLSLLNF